MLADQFVEGAKAAGNDVEKISLAGKNIQFCKGCLACQKLGRCVINDDVNDIMAKVLQADVICWATPIYYYEMSGQMKTLIDRMNAMYELDYQFRVASEEEEQHRKAYMKQQEEYFQRLDEMIQGSRHMKKKRASKWLKRAGDIV